MPTEKLFDRAPYQTTFTAQVTACTPGKTGYAVVLDRTCFYPEGGGQPGDTGTLDAVPVTDTQEQDGQIFHMTENPLAVGQTVTGTIDWARRFDLMQQHSGEHIVSGIIHRRFGYDNVGFHMGADAVTIDLSGELTDTQLQEVEQEANALLWKDREIRCWYPTAEELRSMHYRSKKELTGDVRIVEIPEGDVCACCGTHVARTGEIGLIQFLSREKLRGGVRVELLCGGRAYRHCCAVAAQNRQISQLLSAKALQTAAAVEALAGELSGAKQRIYTLEEAQFSAVARAHAGEENVTVRMDDLTPDGVRRAAIALQAVCTGRTTVFSGSDETGYRYAAGWPEGDLRQWVQAFSAACGGRGGGKPHFVQGAVTASWAEIDSFLSRP